MRDLYLLRGAASLNGFIKYHFMKLLLHVMFFKAMSKKTTTAPSKLENCTKIKKHAKFSAVRVYSGLHLSTWMHKFTL